MEMLILHSEGNVTDDPRIFSIMERPAHLVHKYNQHKFSFHPDHCSYAWRTARCHHSEALQSVVDGANEPVHKVVINHRDNNFFVLFNGFRGWANGSAGGILSVIAIKFSFSLSFRGEASRSRGGVRSARMHAKLLGGVAPTCSQSTRRGIPWTKLSEKWN